MNGEGVRRMLLDLLLDHSTKSTGSKRSKSTPTTADKSETEYSHRSPGKATDVRYNTSCHKADIGIATEVLACRHRDCNIEICKECAC